MLLCDHVQEFAAEMAAAEQLLKDETLRAESAEAAVAVAQRELDQARAKAAEVGDLETRYWHDFNDFQLQLRAHVDERDVLLSKVGCLLCTGLKFYGTVSIICLLKTKNFNCFLKYFEEEEEEEEEELQRYVRCVGYMLWWPSLDAENPCESTYCLAQLVNTC